MSNTKLIIYFIKQKQVKPFYDSFIFLKKRYNIKNQKITIDIGDNYFNEFKEKIVLDFEIISSDILNGIFKYKINIFYGINKAYCFLTEKNKISIEYNYIDDHEFFYEDLNLNEYDGNGLVRRLVLINAPTSLIISKKIISLEHIILNYSQGSNSFEIADFDCSKEFFGVRPIEFDEKFSIIKEMKAQKKPLEEFYIDLKTTIKSGIVDKEIYKQLYNKYDKRIKEIDFNFTQKKKLLENEFGNNDDYFLMFLYWVWNTIKTTFLNEKEKFDCKYSINDLINCMTDFYNIYLNDKDLKVYQKIMLFFSHTSFFLEKNDMKKYNAADLKYIKRKDIRDESVYKMSYDFLEKFISKLSEKSYLFFPLLMLDCGDYYYSKDNEYIYGYNRESCDVIKSHLNELIPDIFFEYNEKGNVVEEESGFNYKYFRVIFLNRLTIFKNLKKIHQ